jgi:hypothetical protein
MEPLGQSRPGRSGGAVGTEPQRVRTKRLSSADNLSQGREDVRMLEDEARALRRVGEKHAGSQAAPGTSRRTSISKANAGTGKIAGRCTASASARVNSRLVTGRERWR